jgi:hypothetical protein
MLSPIPTDLDRYDRTRLGGQWSTVCVSGRETRGFVGVSASPSGKIGYHCRLDVVLLLTRRPRLHDWQAARRLSSSNHPAP